jgi:hypothetical protein
MPDKDLFEAFHASAVEQAELEQVLGQHFHGAMTLNPDEVVYPGHDQEYAVKLRYDDGVLAEIIPGPQLKSADKEAIRERIANELLTSQGIGVGRTFLFSSVPVEGYFRYGDVFQFLPVPLDAPRPEFQMAEHPFALEFRYPTSSNASIRHLRRALLEREFELLLAGLLEFGVRGLGRTARHHWVLPQRDLSVPWRSAYLQEMYTWPGGVLEAENFADVTGIPQLSKIDPAEYYSRSGIGPDRRLEVPSELNNLLEQFFTLSKHDRERFLRACFWFQHARLVHSYSRSAAFTALISAVEALIPRQRGTPICDKCHRPIGPGATQQFVDFVERFAPSSVVSDADRRKFYGIRSALSHGGSLLHSDRRAWSPGLTPEKVKEWDDISTMWRLVRVVLVNWLGPGK